MPGYMEALTNSPEPWTASGSEGPPGADIMIKDANGELVGQAFTIHKGRGNAEGNARLFAAAPDLHKAAQAIIEWANLHLPDCVLCGAGGLDSHHAQDCPVSIAAAAIAKAWQKQH